MSAFMELGPHSGFIWAAYSVFFVALAVLTAWIVTDGARNQRLLAELEAQGVRRRSAAAQPAPPPKPARAPEPAPAAAQPEPAAAPKPRAQSQGAATPKRPRKPKSQP
jgi:heme exporter protein CcmD